MIGRDSAWLGVTELDWAWLGVTAGVPPVIPPPPSQGVGGADSPPPSLLNNKNAWRQPQPAARQAPRRHRIPAVRRRALRFAVPTPLPLPLDLIPVISAVV